MDGPVFASDSSSGDESQEDAGHRPVLASDTESEAAPPTAVAARPRRRTPRDPPKAGTVGVWLVRPYKPASSSSASAGFAALAERLVVVGLALLDWSFEPAVAAEGAVGHGGGRGGRGGRGAGSRKSSSLKWGRIVYDLRDVDLLRDGHVLGDGETIDGGFGVAVAEACGSMALVHGGLVEDYLSERVGVDFSNSMSVSDDLFGKCLTGDA